MSRQIRGLAALARAGAIAAGLAGPMLPWPTLASAAEGVTPIRFAPGASSAEISGGVERGGRAIYSFGARAGQMLRLRVEAVERNAAVQIYRPGATLAPDDTAGLGGVTVVGTALPGAGEGQDASAWSGRLPESGTYLVVVGATRGGATYRLSLSIH